MNNISLVAKTEPALREAGRLFLKSAPDMETMVKGFANYVTEIDFKVQDYLVKELSGILPGSNIITEESSQNQYDLSKPTWILDPVDGTANLMRGYRHSAISLALVIDKKPALGMIYNPFLNEMFIGDAGRGAYLNGNRIKVSSASKLEDCIITFGTTPYISRDKNTTIKVLDRVFAKCQDLRRSGSAALDLAYVACGRIDAFFEICLQPWDFAAGLLILEEAGGKITDMTGGKPELIKQGSILASNELVHEDLLGLF
ncbi:MAG: inositol monophosphatase family protein [Bacillota bacterium]|nr:inositol monophosphatase family protein [Bacillota bacterium]